MSSSPINPNSEEAVKFVTGNATTAVLQPNGKFFLKDGTANLEAFDNWRDFVKSMGEEPVKAGHCMEDAVLLQLQSLGLGTAYPMSFTPSTGKPVKTKETPTMAKNNGSTPKTNGTAAKQPPAKTAVPKKTVAPAARESKPSPAKKEPVDPATLPFCLCGCGEHVLNAKREFRQGHDARTHGYAKKVERGEMKLSELQPLTQKWMKDHGIKQGTPAKK